MVIGSLGQGVALFVAVAAVLFVLVVFEGRAGRQSRMAGPTPG